MKLPAGPDLGFRDWGLGFRVILGLSWGYVRAILGLYWGNGKSNGNYNNRV